jgi:hypothetical protein
MSVKSMGYDHPSYLARVAHVFPALAAGASGATSKFVAFTALQVFAITVSQVTAAAGTSTATLYNGTSTVTAINADTYSVIRVMNNAAVGATPSLTTSTYGPFVASLYNGTATGTQTNVAGFTNSVALNGTATTGQAQLGAGVYPYMGGFTVNQGDQLFVQRGTDASSVLAIALEYNVLPLANVTA